ncbi:MAG: histidinol-phosphate transaminase [Anaerolineae bacterium]|nr:histidinol-phosphate transaminase [Anaerolineae bacterium]
MPKAISSTKFDVNHFIRPNVATLNPYTPILPFEVLSQQLGRRPDEIIKLDANENPYGPSPRVAEALAGAPYLHIYPDPESRALRQALADFTGLEADYLLVGNGADELIDLVMRLVIEPGDGIINCPPTFGMYAFDADVNGANLINIWRRGDFAIPIDQIEAQFATPTDKRPPIKLIFVTSPNNPDGSLLSDPDLKRLLALPTLVVLDEAYIEFCGGSRIGWVKQYPNLIVLRTFSKWAGLAGMRIGYGAFPLDIIEHLWKIKQPYNLSVAAQLAAQVSLDDRTRLLSTVEQLIAERERFYTSLTSIDWLTPYPSHTNFVLCKVTGRDAARVKQQLAEQGILVRYYRSKGLSDHLRFSMGRSEQMARVVEVLQGLSP